MMFRALVTLALAIPAIVDAFPVQFNGRQDVEAESFGYKRPVNSKQLQKDVTLEALLKHAQTLQDFAYSYPDRNRYFGGSAHNDTVKYVHDTLSNLGGYYDVQLQTFIEPAYISGNWSLEVDGAEVANTTLFQFSPNGHATAALVKVDNLGCEASDFPSTVSGQVALISRGECNFGLKVAYAGSAGAVGVVIYNNIEGALPTGATLVAGPRPEGPYVPAIGVLQATGLGWIEQLDAGNTVTADVLVEGSSQVDRYSQNVIAQTKGGNQDDVLQLGAHSDSVEAGPGINDNGSGSIALLEVAKQLAKYTVKNAVRFSWWSAEEEGLLGSTYYVSQLSEEEAAKIRLYLNFDMISSPNYVLAAYDGDGSAFNISGPPGSAEAEKLFQDYYDSIGQNWTSSEFNGRSDYGPFLEAGIASGGLDTGAEGIKTEEEAALFGGEAGVAYDINYHGAGDTIDNLAHLALEVNSKGIAHAVATYATSFDSLPAKGAVSLSKTTSTSNSIQFSWKGDTLIA